MKQKNNKLKGNRTSSVFQNIEDKSSISTVGEKTNEIYNEDFEYKLAYIFQLLDRAISHRLDKGYDVARKIKEIISEVVIIHNEYPKNQFIILLNILTLDRIYDLNFLGHALEVVWDILCELDEE